MTNRDSFIDEVTDDLRRDRLFRLFRRWAWVAILLVVFIVVGAGYNEWRKSRDREGAEARGDAIIAALGQEGVAQQAQALGNIGAEGAAGAMLTMLAAAQSTDGPARAAAIDRLEQVAADSALDRIWTDLAVLKAVMLDGAAADPADRLARLDPLISPGAPYRTLALEQVALAQVAAGDGASAIATLTDLLSDEEAPQGLQSRARQLIVALGGSVEPT